MPRVVLTHMPLVAAHLGGGAYPLRSAMPRCCVHPTPPLPLTGTGGPVTVLGQLLAHAFDEPRDNGNTNQLQAQIRTKQAKQCGFATSEGSLVSSEDTPEGLNTDYGPTERWIARLLGLVHPST
eukprot:1189466-Prorocentrum_minimum.AAC.1